MIFTYNFSATLLLAESEYGAIFRKYYGDTFGQFMQNLHRLSNNGIDCEQVDSFIEQSLSIAYVVSCSFEGIWLFYTIINNVFASDNYYW